MRSTAPVDGGRSPLSSNGMSTNVQTQTDFIFSIPSDGPGLLISVAMLVLAVSLQVMFLKRRRKV